MIGGGERPMFASYCQLPQPLDLDMAGSDSRDAQNAPVFDGNVCDADMVPELVLARELV